MQNEANFVVRILQRASREAVRRVSDDALLLCKNIIKDGAVLSLGRRAPLLHLDMLRLKGEAAITIP